MTLGVLNYGGNAGVEDMAAFNARLHWTWSGDHLFRVYPTDGKLYFIRVGGSRHQNAAVGAQFGLLGALIVYFTNKHKAKKTQQLLNTIAGTHPAGLMSSHKHNFVLDGADVRSATVTPGGFWHGTSLGRMRVVDSAGKKYRLTFDDADNLRAAVEQLGVFLGDRLVIDAEWDEAKGKYRKKR
jgi:hypothetical protein